MKALNWLLLAAVLSLATGCPTNSLLDGATDPGPAGDGGGGGGAGEDGGVPDAGELDAGTPADAGIDYSAFVIDQILNNTNETGRPVPIEDLNFVNQNLDSTSPFQSLFP